MRIIIASRCKSQARARPDPTPWPGLEQVAAICSGDWSNLTRLSPLGFNGGDGTREVQSCLQIISNQTMNGNSLLLSENEVSAIPCPGLGQNKSFCRVFVFVGSHVLAKRPWWWRPLCLMYIRSHRGLPFLLPPILCPKATYRTRP